MCSHDPIHTLSLPVLMVASAFVAAGCDYGTPSTHARSGLSSSVKAQVAPSVLAARGTAAQPPEAKPNQGAKLVAAPDDAKAAGDSAPTAEPQLADLKIKRLLLARSVDAREPVDAADAFALDEVERIYAFVEVDNRDRVESEIFVTFEPEQGPARGHVQLRVGPSPRWRTWAYTRGVRKAGKWTAVVRNSEGELLARKSFEVKPAVPAKSDGASDVPGPAARPAPRDESVAAKQETPSSRG